MPDLFFDDEQRLARFNRLIQDLFRENVNRNSFQPWEIELLLDIQSCQLRESSKRETLLRYQKTVQRQLEKGVGTLPKLSEFLLRERGRRTQTSLPPLAGGLETEDRALP